MTQQHKPERLDRDTINEQAIIEDRKKKKADQIGAGLAVILFLVVMIPAALVYGWDILGSWSSVGWMVVCLIAYWIFSRTVRFVLPDSSRQDITSKRWYDSLDWGTIIGGGSVLLIIAAYMAGYGIWTFFESREESKFQQVKRAPISSIISSYHKHPLRADEAFKDGVITSVRVRGITNQGVLEIHAGGYNHVEAYLKDTSDALSIDRGDSVSLYCGHTRGSGDSLGSFVYLRDCEILIE